MDTKKFASKKNIKMIAHRGISGLERENTCPAFVAAGMRSYWGIETDVHVTKDGKYIIHHDDDVSRLTGEALVIRETEFDRLRELRMVDLDKKTMRGDLFLPSLDEYLSICRKYEKIAVLELKESIAEEHINGIMDAVEAAGMLENTVFISFYGQNLLKVRRRHPQAKAQFLTSSLTEENIRFMLENGLEADVAFKTVTPEFVQRMHDAGRTVNVWTVNSVEDAQLLADFGVDMITTNILE